MEVQDTHSRVSFASISGKSVEATFDGGTLTSDSGALLLRAGESQVGVVKTGKLITAILRPGARPTGNQIVSLLKRLIAHLRQAWPQVEIFLRGDGHFSCPEVHDFCDANRVYFALGQTGNSRLS